MDAHYDQVMKARANAGQGTRWYFAYSTILDRAAFDEWKTQHGYEFFELPQGQLAEAAEVALVYDFPSRWWGGRVAGLGSAAGSHVCGVVFEIADKEWPIIQHKEGAVTGMSVERDVEVKLGDGRSLRATAFSTNPTRQSSEGPVSDRFVEALVRGARASGLPEWWIQTLEKGVGKGNARSVPR
jgi:gamma-glutamylcyclotransferase